MYLVLQMKKVIELLEKKFGKASSSTPSGATGDAGEGPPKVRPTAPPPTGPSASSYDVSIGVATAGCKFIRVLVT